MPLNNPPLNQLMQKVDSKYTLIVLAAKRARHLIANDTEMLQKNQCNPVSVALTDIIQEKVHWKRTKEGIK
ncbi:MAG: DNA-directed RNA polymerase subunit omega [Bacillota bacterium]|jgi:DNA-directed RNA polymerase subunit omega